MLQFLGKLHLLFLHLPIGLLSFAFFLELRVKWTQNAGHQHLARIALTWGALAAVVSAGSGWLLSRQGGYEADLLQKHQWTGFTTAALAVLAWKLQSRSWYFPILLLCILTLVVAGHYGGSLTHGADFLFESKPVAQTAAAAPETVVFTSLVQPILKRKCLSCHNENKKKGDLLLDTPEHIMKGGKHGPILLPGSPDSSSMIRRSMLPLHHDDHMPPAGKLQLEPEELTLLKWWIAQGASFDKTLGTMSVPPEVNNILHPVKVEPSNPVFAKSVAAADTRVIDQLRSQGIAVEILGAVSPWLSISMAGNHQVKPEMLEALGDASQQVSQLDLGNTNVDDEMLRKMPDLPHLTRLNLFQTGITDASVSKIRGWKYLDCLNLGRTKVTDAGLSQLSELKQLHVLYLWQTVTSVQGRAALQGHLTGIRIETGPPTDTSQAPVALRMPKLLYSRNIFEDTLQVLLDYPKLVDVYYSFGEASPTTQSSKYKHDPIVLDHSTKIRAIAAKEGWADSPVAEAEFVKRKYKIQTATIGKAPSEKYPGNGALSLYDGKIGETHLDKAFLGYEGEHLEAVLDLGQPFDVSRVSIHCLENNSAWIFLPRGLQVWTSSDGTHWKPFIQKQFPVNETMGDVKTHILSESAPQPVNCRYLKVKVESLLQNPKWHPGAGKKCWIFVDEMLVE